MNLRPQSGSDLPLLTGGESAFDDFGPRSRRTVTEPAELDEPGGLMVLADDDQVAEQRTLESAGFTREEIVRGAQWRDGAFHDGLLYAILRDDPRPDR